MFPFNIKPNDKEPTKEELFEGLVHYVSTLLYLHGAGKHTCQRINDLRLDTLKTEDIWFIMDKGMDSIEKLKTILSNLPTIQVSRGE